MDNQPWINKYQPEKEQDILGQEKAITQLKKYITEYQKQKKKVALLSGPSGCGKTSSVYALANQHNLEGVEINASDFRSKAKLEEFLSPALKQYSLFSQGKLILVDEVDGLSGMKDRGAIAELLKLTTKSKFPVIATAYNAYHDKLRSLRSKAMVIDYEIPDYKVVTELLIKICKAEKVTYQESDLKTIARRSGGDIRAAINDLQLLTTSGELKKESLDELWQRNRIESMPQALVKVLKSTDPKIAISAFDNVQEDIDAQMLWIDENLPKEYKDPEDLERAYNNLSKADVFKGRIRRWQHWRFLVYVNALLSAGVATSKKQKSTAFVQYGPTGRILKLWWAKRKYMKRKAIAAKIAEATHSSTRQVIQDTFPYLQSIVKKDKAFAKKFQDEFDLDDEEIAWMQK